MRQILIVCDSFVVPLGLSFILEVHDTCVLGTRYLFSI